MTPLEKSIAAARRLIEAFDGEGGRHNSGQMRFNITKPSPPVFDRLAQCEPWPFRDEGRQITGRWKSGVVYKRVQDCRVGDAVHENDFPLLSSASDGGGYFTEPVRMWKFRAHDMYLRPAGFSIPVLETFFERVE